MTPEDATLYHAGVLPPGVTLKPVAEFRGTKTPKRKNRAPPKGVSSGDRWASFNAFVDVSIANLTRTEMAVWLQLFRDTKRETGLARTGENDLARRCGCSVRSIRSAIRKLEKKHLLRQVRRGDLHSGPSVYKVLPPGSAEV